MNNILSNYEAVDIVAYNLGDQCYHPLQRPQPKILLTNTPHE